MYHIFKEKANENRLDIRLLALWRVLDLYEQIATEPETTLDDEQKNDYTAFDCLISKMHLTAVEYETLSILMAGFTGSKINGF